MDELRGSPNMEQVIPVVGWSGLMRVFRAAFVGCLDSAGVLKLVSMLRNLEGYRDIKSLRNLVHQWSPSFNTFFFFVGELTITSEDVVNTFMLPIFGDESSFN